MRALEWYIILQLLIMRVPFSLFSEPRIYSIILYICSILTSKSPHAFARVPVPTRVNEGDTFISTDKPLYKSNVFLLLVFSISIMKSVDVIMYIAE